MRVLTLSRNKTHAKLLRKCHFSNLHAKEPAQGIPCAGSLLYSLDRLAKYLPQQLRRGHLATQHPLALLPHLRRYLTALHADGGLRVLHGKYISLVTVLVHRKTPRVIREESGACGRIRTGDLLITSELLCQLSHTSVSSVR